MADYALLGIGDHLFFYTKYVGYVIQNTSKNQNFNINNKSLLPKEKTASYQHYTKVSWKSLSGSSDHLPLCHLSSTL